MHPKRLTAAKRGKDNSGNKPELQYFQYFKR
jgi:hypothetical protein